MKPATPDLEGLDEDEMVTFTLEGRPDCVGLGLTVKRQALALGWSALEGAELALLVIELGNNAVRHGGGGSCRVSVSNREVRIEVDDRGPGFPEWVLENQPRPDRAIGALHRHPGQGLGAGLDCARRLAHLLRLENRSEGGARAVAARYRLKKRTHEEQP